MVSRFRLDDLVESSEAESMTVGQSMRGEHRGCGKGNASASKTPVGILLHCFKCGAKGLARSSHAEVRNPTYALSVIAGAKTGILPSSYHRADSKEYASACLALGIPSYLAREALLCVSEPENGTPTRVWFPLTRIYEPSSGAIAFGALAAGYAGKAVVRPSAVSTSRKWDVSILPEAGSPNDGTLVYCPERHVSRLGRSTMLVLVEDPISALKIHDCAHTNLMAVVPIAMLGLSLGDTLLRFAAAHDGPVVLWVDGDAPGKLRGTKLLAQLEFLRAGKFTGLHYINGLDPKDLNQEHMGEELDRLCKKASYRPEHMETV